MPETFACSSVISRVTVYARGAIVSRRAGWRQPLRQHELACTDSNELSTLGRGLTLPWKTVSQLLDLDILQHGLDHHIEVEIGA